MGDDLAALGEWASIFTRPAELSATIAKHMALHRKAIKADIALDKAEWDAQEWWAAGVTTADLATLAIGPVTPVYPSFVGYEQEFFASSGTPANFSALAVPDFVAGLIYGFTGDNQLPEIEACFHGSQQLVTDAENLLNDLENKNWIKAIEDNADFAT